MQNTVKKLGMLQKKASLPKKINFQLPKKENLINKDPPVTPNA